MPNEVLPTSEFSYYMLLSSGQALFRDYMKPKVLDGSRITLRSRRMGKKQFGVYKNGA